MILLLRWLLFTLAIMFVAWLVPGIGIENFQSAMLVTVIMALINIFIRPFMFCLITGWIIGLGTGIAGLVFSIMQKKECGKTSRSVSISILGIVLNLLWLSGIMFAFSAWKGI